MRIVHTRQQLGSALQELRKAGSLGFVPTMGALHEGHMQLVREAGKSCASTAVSIFVNPLQFGPSEDFQRYPRTLEQDAALCERDGVSLLFAPSPADMYPAGFRTSVEVDGLGDKLCGKSRPGHFRGVATVVLKLLNLLQPERAFFGQKDFQQTVVLRTMARDLDLPCELVVVPTVRETDGLAMSSRNRYLSPGERREASALFRALKAIERLASQGVTEIAALREAGLQELRQSPSARLDYLEIVSPDNLEPLKTLQGPAFAAIAAWIGGTRLIDNLRLDLGTRLFYD